jgi:cell division protein FtsB
LWPIVLGGVLVSVLGIAVAGARSYRDLAIALSRVEQLSAEITERAHRVELLETRIERLRADADTIERAARQELGVVRTDEIIVVLPR